MKLGKVHAWNVGIKWALDDLEQPHTYPPVKV
jgi:hypothetical protein